MEKPQLKLLKDRSGGERIADTFTFLRINLAVLLQTHFLLSLPVVLLTAALFVVLFPGDFSLLTTLSIGPFVDTAAQREDNFQDFLQFLFFLSATLPVTTNTLIVFDQFARANGQLVAFPEVFKSFKKHFLKLYLAKILLGAIIVLSGFLLVLPALAFYTLFMCVEMLVLQHGFGIGKAINRSTNIMAKSFWGSFGVNLALFLLVGAGMIGILLMEPLLEWLASMAFEEVRGNSVWMRIGQALGAFNSMMGYLFFMLPAAGAGIQFFTLREEISRTDIMQRVREIGTKETVSTPQFSSDEHY